jgi:hypothetical protein
MSGQHYTPVKYALQNVVESLVNLLYELAEHRLSHTYAVVLPFCPRENIEYLVLKYLNTSVLPFDEFSEEWLHEGEI